MYYDLICQPYPNQYLLINIVFCERYHYFAISNIIHFTHNGPAKGLQTDQRAHQNATIIPRININNYIPVMLQNI